MAKKSLSFDNPLFEQSEKKSNVGRPRNENLIRTDEGGSASQAGLTEDYTRFTVITKVKNVSDLKNYAYTKRIPIRDAIDEILEDFFTRYRSDPDNEPILHRRKD